MDICQLGANDLQAIIALIALLIKSPLSLETIIQIYGFLIESCQEAVLTRRGARFLL